MSSSASRDWISEIRFGREVWCQSCWQVKSVRVLSNMCQIIHRLFVKRWRKLSNACPQKSCVVEEFIFFAIIQHLSIKNLVSEDNGLISHGKTLSLMTTKIFKLIRFKTKINGDMTWKTLCVGSSVIRVQLRSSISGLEFWKFRSIGILAAIFQFVVRSLFLNLV